jgi:hypothetical protein
MAESDAMRVQLGHQVVIQVLQTVVVIAAVVWMVYLLLELSSLLDLKICQRKRSPQSPARPPAISFGHEEKKRNNWHLKSLLFANTLANLIFISIIAVLAFKVPFADNAQCNYLGIAVLPIYGLTAQTTLMFRKSRT